MSRQRNVAVGAALVALGATGAVGIVLPAMMAQAPRGASPEAQAAVASFVAQARALADAKDAEWRAGMAAALAGAAPRPDLGRCPIEIPVPPPRGGDGRQDQTMEAALAQLVGIRHFALVHRDGIAGAHAPTWTYVDRELEGARYSEPERLRALASDEVWGWDLVVVADELRPPFARDDGTFDAGVARGRAYLWSYGERTVVCAADVAAESSGLVRYTTTGIGGVGLDGWADAQGAIRHDFEMEVLRSAAPALVRAGPVVAADGGASLDSRDASP